MLVVFSKPLKKRIVGIVFLEDNSSNCDLVSTSVAVDGVYRIFNCDVGEAGINKSILCAVNSNICSPGVNASSEVDHIDVISPVSCIENSQPGPLSLTSNKNLVESINYSSGGVLDFKFNISNLLEANILNLNHEISLYNLNTKEEIFKISKPSPVSAKESFNYTFNLPNSGLQDKFRLYLKAYNPSNEIGACDIKKFDLNIAPGSIDPSNLDIDFRNITNKRITASFGETKTFTLDGLNKHHLNIAQVLETGAIVTISSDPFNVTLETGVSQEIDIDGDGIPDLNLTIVSLEGENVNLDLGILKTFESCAIGESRTCTDGIKTGTEFCVGGVWTACQYNQKGGSEKNYTSPLDENEDPDYPAPISKEDQKKYLYFALGIIGILILAIVIVFIKKRKKKVPPRFVPAPVLPIPPKKKIPFGVPKSINPNFKRSIQRPTQNFRTLQPRPVPRPTQTPRPNTLPSSQRSKPLRQSQKPTQNIPSKQLGSIPPRQIPQKVPSIQPQKPTQNISPKQPGSRPQGQSGPQNQPRK